MFSCEGGNRICEKAVTSSILEQAAQFQKLNLLLHCLPGLETLGHYTHSCEIKDFPTYSVFGAKPNKLYLPTGNTTCDYLFGELYVYLSCLERCANTSCPVELTPLEGTTCSKSLKHRTFSISSDGELTFVRQMKGEFVVSNMFVCKNQNCVPYSKVCNLIDDCGDGSDEDMCSNHFLCYKHDINAITKGYIPKSSLCDGVFDCRDFSDEILCCEKRLINELPLKLSSWTIGGTAVLLNGIIPILNIATIRRIQTSSALTDKTLITLISLGDWLVGAYLLAISIDDAYIGKNFCAHQNHWLVSLKCSLLGVISTVGGQISLFAMTILSFTRLLKLSRGMMISGPINKISYISMLIIVFSVVGTSVIIATIPLSSELEDIFVNSLFLPNINFLNGFVDKNSLKYTIESYYGLVKLDVSELSWKNIKLLIHSMFTNEYGGIEEKVLGFYGNDPVCLFKFFVTPAEPQTTYSWMVLGVNFTCFLIISLSYFTVFTVSSASSASLKHSASGDFVRNRNARLQRKISIIILTDFLCWMPFILVSFLHTIGVVNASPWYALLSIVILPINSVINPVLYDNSIRLVFGRLMSLILRALNTTSEGNRTSDSKVHSQSIPNQGSFVSVGQVTQSVNNSITQAQL